MHEGLVQKLSLKRRHASILSRLSVEEQVGRHNRPAHDSCAIEESLGERARWRSDLAGLRGIVAVEGGLKGISGFHKGSDG